MLRVSHLRKLVKPASGQCPDPLIALLGTEVGTPVSEGLTVNIIEGSVVSTGTGYDFTDGVLSVTTPEQCPVNSEMTFSISGIGPVPPLTVIPTGGWIYLIAVLTGGLAYAAYKYPDSHWAIPAVPLAVPDGVAYELKCSIADTWVGLWLNGSRVARAVVTPEYLATTRTWTVIVGRYSNETYTGHVDSVSFANGALPDIDVL